MSELRLEREGAARHRHPDAAPSSTRLPAPCSTGFWRAADELERDEACRVVILTGEGTRPSAPAPTSPNGVADAAGVRAPLGRRGPSRVRPLGTAAPAGDRHAQWIAFGGGLELAATADYRLAEAHARVGLPESQVGIVPGWSGTQRLVRRAGAPAVKRLVLTGEPVDAAEALRARPGRRGRGQRRGYGPRPGARRHMAQRAPVAMQTAKLLVNAAEGEEASAAIEVLAGALAAGTADAREGVQAFRDKRAPSVRGQVRAADLPGWPMTRLLWTVARAMRPQHGREAAEATRSTAVRH